MHAYTDVMYTMLVPGALRNQKRALHTLKLELVVVSHYMGPGKQTPVQE